MTKGKYFWLRSVGSSILGLTIFNLLLIIKYLIFYWPCNIKQLFFISVIDDLWRVIFVLILAFPAIPIIHWLRTIENLDKTGDHLDFNPFKQRLDNNISFPMR